MVQITLINSIKDKRAENDRIIEITDPLKKSVYARSILEELPEWFGNKEALDDYSEEVKKLPFWAAFNQNDLCIGFFAVKIHYSHTGDIYVCGILPKYHRSGIGTDLYKKAEEYFHNNKCDYIIVKTLSDKASYEPYEHTRKFYKKMGFVPLLTLTEMWDEWNPCLIMLKRLTR